MKTSLDPRSTEFRWPAAVGSAWERLRNAGRSLVAGRRMYVRLMFVSLAIAILLLTVQTVLVMRQSANFAHQVMIEDLVQKGTRINYALQQVRPQGTNGGSGGGPRGATFTPPGGEESIQAVLESLSNFFSVRVWLFDEEGNITAASERGETLPSTPVRASVVERVLAGKTAVVSDWGGSRNTPTVALPMGPPEQVQGGILVSGRNAIGEAPLSRLQLHLVLLAVVFLLIVVFGALYLAETVTHPLDQLSRTAARLARGDIDARVPGDLLTGDAEVAHLAACLNQVSEQLSEARKNRFLLFAELSHELKNPLTVIGGYLDAISSAETAEEAGRYHHIVRNEVQYLTQLVENLIDLGRLESGAASVNQVPVDLAALARGVGQAMQPSAAARGNVLDVEECDAEVWILGDPGRLEQIVRNLISNGNAATEGGTIRVRVRAHGSQALLEVEDDGIGIPPEVLSHIWRQFYRHPEVAAARENGSDRPRATGLGLAITRRLVELHQGRIEVESQVGEGSRFRVILPLSPGAGGLRSSG